MSMDFAEKYGPWGIVCGGSDGIGAALARALASRGVVLVTSSAAWAGGATLAAYGATKAFDLILAEALWAEWHDHGVDVLGLVVTATDTPSLHRALAANGGYHGDLADPDDVAVAALDHLADGPTWMCGGQDPLGPPPFGSVTRREAVLRMSRR